MNEILSKIVEAGLQAPSGENAQPWKFKISSKTLEVYNVPQRDTSLYNWEQRASYMANGAAVENLTIASKNFGFNPEVTLFPDSDKDHVATINLIEQPEQNDKSLYSQISKRVTNRKPYKSDPISKSDLDSLSASFHDSSINLYFVTNESGKKLLGHAGSTNERVMLSNKFLHHFFFSHISWTKSEDEKKKIGFYIETLELPPPAKLAFKVIKNWPIINILNKLGFYKAVGKQNGEVNSKAGAFGCLTIKDLDPISFVKTGRALQRLWLSATKLGLSLQPLTGVLFFMHQIRSGNTNKFSSNQIAMIEDAYKNIEGEFKIKNNEIVAFMFRIGQSEPPTARSSKFTFKETVEIV